MRRALLMSLGLLAVSAAAGSVRGQPAPEDDTERAPQSAEPEPCSAERFLLLAVGPEVDSDLEWAIRRELATELAHRGLGLCAPGNTTREPAALVQLTLRENEASIALDDRTTHKRVEREVRLDRLPAGGRALALAIAIDELLRASWAELALSRESEPAEPAPVAAAQETPPAALAPPALAQGERTRPRLGLSFGTLHSTERLNAFALAAQLELFPLRHGWVALSAGGLRALSVEEGPGEVTTTGATFALALGGCIPAGSRTSLCVGPRGGADYLAFHAEPKPGARARRGSGWLLRAEGVAAVEAALGSRLWLSAQLGAGAALHGVNASDGSRTLVGASGLLLTAQLGLGVSL